MVEHRRLGEGSWRVVYHLLAVRIGGLGARLVISVHVIVAFGAFVMVSRLVMSIRTAEIRTQPSVLREHLDCRS